MYFRYKLRFECNETPVSPSHPPLHTHKLIGKQEILCMGEVLKFLLASYQPLEVKSSRFKDQLVANMSRRPHCVRADDTYQSRSGNKVQVVQCCEVSNATVYLTVQIGHTLRQLPRSKAAKEDRWVYECSVCEGGYLCVRVHVRVYVCMHTSDVCEWCQCVRVMCVSGVSAYEWCVWVVSVHTSDVCEWCQCVRVMCVSGVSAYEWCVMCVCEWCV